MASVEIFPREKRDELQILQKALNSKNSSTSFHSALGNCVFDNANHAVLFDKIILISNDLEINQVIPEATEMTQN